MSAEADARREVPPHSVEDVSRKPDRVISIGHGGPHVESRARRFDRPAQCVQRVSDEPVTPRVYLTSRARLLLSPIQRLDSGPLDRLEDPGVDVGLELADEAGA